MTYAQNGEDDILARFFGAQSNGVYVDIGAHDGVTYSNTYLFEERGWTGVCVEADPHTFAKLERRRQATCIHAAVVGSPEQTQATLYRSKMDVLSTLTTAHEREIAMIHGNVGLRFDGFTTVDVPAMTLDDLFEQHQLTSVDLLSIDVEWTNGDVLRGFTLMRWRPRVVVIETGSGVSESMANYHYCFEHGSNLFYVRDASDVMRMQAAYVHC